MGHDQQRARDVLERMRMSAALRIVAIAIILAMFMYALAPRAFVSSEVYFADQSRQGLSIVPASGESCNSTGTATVDDVCPGDMCFNLDDVQSGPPAGYYLHETTGVYRLCCPNGYTHDTFNCYPPGDPPVPPNCIPTTNSCGVQNYSNCPSTGTYNPNLPGCQTSCTPSLYCSDKTLYRTDSSCQTSVVRQCAYQCVGGACVIPDPPIPDPDPPEEPDPVFNGSGRLEVRPTLVRAGSRVRLYWKYLNVESCTVTGSNGDEWSDDYSGASGVTSSPLQARTTFTLNCTALPDATPATISESVTVNIAPTFNEQ